MWYSILWQEVICEFSVGFADARCCVRRVCSGEIYSTSRPDLLIINGRMFGARCQCWSASKQ